MPYPRYVLEYHGRVLCGDKDWTSALRFRLHGQCVATPIDFRAGVGGLHHALDVSSTSLDPIHRDQLRVLEVIADNFEPFLRDKPGRPIILRHTTINTIEMVEGSFIAADRVAQLVGPGLPLSRCPQPPVPRVVDWTQADTAGWFSL
ncbi:hypothetical protein RM531_08020 [Salinisphaera sp. P385]|uniref:Uncharacterized protein n=1 Tax=Spectribacter acetivorans TaxID=3075603 RepID=A0ABU3B8M6_9GAMM|nr:hypothetical protein [Salinisphaera sp. P385]MDT0618420.1 hypothetical protein [Salinisphaera sp. P385]